MTADCGHRLTPDELEALSRDAFVDVFGDVFEHSPWVAERAHARGPFRSLDALHSALVGTLRDAAPELQTAVIAAHPELSPERVDTTTLSAASASEQASVGLNRLADEDRARLRDAVEAYRQRFGLPCVVCVRDHTTARDVVAAIERRIDADRETEIATSLVEVGKIARFRLADLVEDPGPAALTTHVLDVVAGGSAAGMSITLSRWTDQGWLVLARITTNERGRTDAPVLAGGELASGRYELRFDVGAYFAAGGSVAGDPPFLTEVPVQVNLAAGGQYHVPLIVSPWSYSTYRGG